ncbi:hypothetical protein Mapa_014841 [Marchantia paleacea]|nr:hypothetical protein Mapa_014841 [Marchantia paleacea]
MQGCTNLGWQATGLAIPVGGALSSIACSQRCRAAGAGDCGKGAKFRSRRVHQDNFNQKLRLGGNFSSSFSFAGNGPKNLRMVKQTGALVGQQPMGCGFIRCAGSGNLNSSSSVEVIGTIVLTKKYVIDLSDTASSLVDNTLDLLGYKVDFQIVSVDLDPKSNGPKVSNKSSITNWATQDDVGDTILAAENFLYKIKFTLPKDFGEPGAFFVRNNHRNEFFLVSLTLELPDKRTIAFPCNSWIYSTSNYSRDRVFFGNKVYLPDQTPSGLRALRDMELEVLRGDGKGERKEADRIYDYDVYNDLGSTDNIRPVLGGKKLPYPRRCRTGRPKTQADPKSEESIEQGTSLVYVPRDERFNRVKNSGFLAGGVKSVAHFIVPALTSYFDGTPNEFDSIKDVKSIYAKGIDLSGHMADQNGDVKKNSKKPQENPYVLLDTIFDADGDSKSVINFPLPQLIATDENAWLLDEEFGRQSLSGLNPCVIKLLKDYPPKSNLDPSVYGSGSALQEKHILANLQGLTVAKALEDKRLFTIDYHDIFMPHMSKINAVKDGGRGYAPRVIFFHTNEGTMMPVAIELSLPPPKGGNISIRRVFTPPSASPTQRDYIWELAKLHFNAIDFGYHELVTHWLRSHAAMEPIIISSNRQLSRMHPIFNLLLPTFKNTMNINAIARQALINANGIIEQTFTPQQYSMEMSAAVFAATWRFDAQALPQDLIARGMAEPADDSYAGGVKLVVDDYPFAKDGLELWDGIKAWVAKYVSIVYDDSDEVVVADTELQSWWNEIVNVGYGDVKSASWWPKLDSCNSLVQIVTTICWMAGPHHAAVNFGQYAYAGFMPNKPPMTRKFIPEVGSPEYQELIADPEKYILSSSTSELAATIVMATIELLATHAIDEEYVGHRNSSDWTSDDRLKAAFAEFTAAMDNLESKINERNNNRDLRNRLGPSLVPYTLLFPTSTSGLTGKGVPYSTSI